MCSNRKQFYVFNPFINTFKKLTSFHFEVFSTAYLKGSLTFLVLEVPRKIKYDDVLATSMHVCVCLFERVRERLREGRGKEVVWMNYLEQYLLLTYFVAVEPLKNLSHLLMMVSISTWMNFHWVIRGKMKGKRFIALTVM